jgi:lipopolysaccharide/colanic/teichoic acid biosynthesis glycosyltransferase
LLVQQFCVVLGFAFLLQALLNYGSWNVVLLPKWTMMYGSLLTLIVLPAWRILFASLVTKALGSQRLLFLGQSSVVRQITACMAERPELGLAAIGYLDNPQSTVRLEGMPRLGAIEDLDRVVAAESPDTIVVAIAERHYHLPVDRLISLGDSGVHIEDAASTYETLFSRVSTRDLDPSQFMFTGELSPRPSGVFLRSAYSLLIGWAAAVVTLPVMAVIAVLIRLSSPGAVLSREKRAGLNGTAFVIFRFRCSSDTALGRWLRRLHLDALPELFNVVKGDMSIIGPRPERPEFVAALEERIPYYGQRHALKPGITGWAQINPQREVAVQDALVELEYDLYYMKNRAISLDTYILLQTVRDHFFHGAA